jgi:hypothetical protein
MSTHDPALPTTTPAATRAAQGTPKNWFQRNLGWKLTTLIAILGLASCGAIINAIEGEGPATTSVPSPVATSVPPAEEPPTSEEPEPEPTEEEKPEPEAKIGDRVTDGALRFVVSSVKCGATRIGDQYLNTKAQGQFCMVKIKVKNISDGPTTFDGDNQTLINTKGQDFSADTEAMFYANDDNQTFLEEINPGNQVTGTLVFDIPKKSKPDHMLLKAGVFGFFEGVTVDVTR